MTSAKLGEKVTAAFAFRLQNTNTSNTQYNTFAMKLKLKQNDRISKWCRKHHVIKQLKRNKL
jgi:hypothetical protein